MKYIHRIEDSDMWKQQFEENAKGKGTMKGGYYVLNQKGKGDSVQFIPSVAKDVIMAKGKIRKYKKRGVKVKKHKTTKRRRGKKVKRIGGKKKATRKIRRKRKTKK